MTRQRDLPQETPLDAPDSEHLPPRVSSEAIACKAHERYQQRGGVHGYDLEDWLAAERELLDELANKH